MAKIVLESDVVPSDIPLKDATPGMYVVTKVPNSFWEGNVIAIPGGVDGVRITGCEAPQLFSIKNTIGIRVRPLRPGEKLVCVE